VKKQVEEGRTAKRNELFGTALYLYNTKVDVAVNRRPSGLFIGKKINKIVFC
jgi:hypothetical protein